MAVRDWVFDRQGRYVIDKPVGWQWQPGDLDSTRFVIVRADLPNEAGLRSRRKGIDPGSVSGQITGNVHGAATVVALADREGYVVGQRWLNLRTGRAGNSQEEALADAREGDGIFIFKRLDTEDDATGWLFLVKKLAPIRIANVGRMTLKEAQTWLS